MFLTEEEACIKLATLHQNLSLAYGSFNEEYEEQVMATMSIAPTARVLEIGGNVGRNSCVISRLLADSSNLVVVESDPQSAQQLQENREANGLQFAIVDSAISRIPLVQNSWDTRPLNADGTIAQDWFPVNSITLDDLKQQHPIAFDTLVIDCEGAFYYILKDEPTILDGIQTVVIENDFHNPDHKAYVLQAFADRGFTCQHCKGHDGFYQVWTLSPSTTV